MSLPQTQPRLLPDDQPVTAVAADPSFTTIEDLLKQEPGVSFDGTQINGPAAYARATAKHLDYGLISA